MSLPVDRLLAAARLESRAAASQQASSYPLTQPADENPFQNQPQPPPDIDWWRTGVIPPAGTYSNYWTDPYTLFTIEVVAMQFAELKRLQDFRFPGSQGKQYFLGLEKVFEGSGNPAYPGGPWFNMFNLGKTEAEMKTLKLKEIKNGRLAMIAMLGYGAQAVMTQQVGIMITAAADAPGCSSAAAIP
jgi:hypothetical protein